MYRPGDKIEIIVEVVEDNGGTITCKTHLENDFYDFTREVLALGRRLPRPIGVGDKVRHPHSGLVWTVTSVRGEWAWCHCAAFVSGHVFLLSALTLAEEGTP